MLSRVIRMGHEADLSHPSLNKVWLDTVQKSVYGEKVIDMLAVQKLLAQL